MRRRSRTAGAWAPRVGLAVSAPVSPPGPLITTPPAIAGPSHLKAVITGTAEAASQPYQRLSCYHPSSLSTPDLHPIDMTNKDHPAYGSDLPCYATHPVSVRCCLTPHCEPCHMRTAPFPFPSPGDDPEPTSAVRPRPMAPRAITLHKATAGTGQQVSVRALYCWVMRGQLRSYHATSEGRSLPALLESLQRAYKQRWPPALASLSARVGLRAALKQAKYTSITVSCTPYVVPSQPTPQIRSVCIETLLPPY